MNVRSLHEITCVGNYACQHVGCANSFFVCAPFVDINGEQKTLAYPTWLQWLNHLAVRSSSCCFGSNCWDSFIIPAYV